MLVKIYSGILSSFVMSSWLYATSMFLAKRKQRSTAFYIGLWVVMVAYFELYELAMMWHGDIIWGAAGLVEIAFLMTLAAVNNEGSLWRNFCIFSLQQNVGGLIFAPVSMMIPELKNYQAYLISFQPMPVWAANCLILGLMNVSLFLSFLIIRFMFRHEYTGDGRIYQKIVIGFILIEYFFGAIRWKFIDRIWQGDKALGNFVALYLVWIAGAVIICNFIPLAYNKSNAKWHKKEQQALTEMLAESMEHYKILERQPFAYRQSLSGIVTLDAVVADYTKRAQERTLLFDAVVEPIHISDMAELDVTAIADTMLETAFSQVSTGADAFVQLTVRQRKGSLFLDVDYLANSKCLPKKQQTLAEVLIKKYDGSRQVRKKGRERQICVLLPNQMTTSKTNK